MNMPRENYNVNWQISWVIVLHEALMPSLLQSWQQDISRDAASRTVTPCQWEISLLPSIPLLSSAPKKNTATAHKCTLFCARAVITSPQHEKAHVCFSRSFSHVRTHTLASGFQRHFGDLVVTETLNTLKQKPPVWAGAHWHNNAVTLFDEHLSEI